MNSKSAITALALVLCFVGAQGGRMFILDDGDFDDQIRYRRDVDGRDGDVRRDVDPRDFDVRREVAERRYLEEEPQDDIQAAGSAAAPIYRRQGLAQEKGDFNAPALVYNPIPPSDLDTQASAHGYKKKKGIVGPVYTFVKTDEYAHVKWGVRHVAGKKYAGHR
ncbi:hypothetical protein TCAL_05404 [Tigriopus californicus]|uniref:Uncharacterized protein n=1 Tax=Tigriopus californicus TaxID=6832 RepID=A0A553P2T0_TIGCA|nr:uncharacterized protein LOC131883125 [Tigriopus californicus]TRY72005.1 hypothetical protein TCAL_05404 [Tigriopus californicus]|eukprot:TCALIF_05404-PA protein Name:"Protein of unknown function" AED:0.00 eAED:0.00 QI:14/1/1/1/0.5/0.66/3/10/163